MVPRLVALLLLVAACAPAAPPDLRPFATAAQEVQSGGQVVYDRLALFLAETPAAAPAEAECVFSSLGVPCRFTPPGAGAAQASGPPELAVRSTLLGLATRYAQLLAETNAARLQASSAEVAALATTAAGLIALVPQAAPFAPVAAALPPLAARLREAGAEAALRAAITADRPTIQAVLAALEQDTPALYEIYAIGRYRAFNLGQASVTSRTEALARRQAARQDIEQYAALLAAYVRALRAMSAALDTLAAATAPSAADSLDQGLGFALEARRLLDAARAATR